MHAVQRVFKTFKLDNEDTLQTAAENDLKFIDFGRLTDSKE